MIDGLVKHPRQERVSRTFPLTQFSFVPSEKSGLQASRIFLKRSVALEIVLGQYTDLNERPRSISWYCHAILKLKKDMVIFNFENDDVT